MQKWISVSQLSVSQKLSLCERPVLGFDSLGFDKSAWWTP
jgi:hypothetical protein